MKSDKATSQGPVEEAGLHEFILSHFCSGFSELQATLQGCRLNCLLAHCSFPVPPLSELVLPDLRSSSITQICLKCLVSKKGDTTTPSALDRVFGWWKNHQKQHANSWGREAYLPTRKPFLIHPRTPPNQKEGNRAQKVPSSFR